MRYVDSLHGTDGENTCTVIPCRTLAYVFGILSQTEPEVVFLLPGTFLVNGTIAYSTLAGVHLLSNDTIGLPVATIKFVPDVESLLLIVGHTPSVISNIALRPHSLTGDELFYGPIVEFTKEGGELSGVAVTGFRFNFDLVRVAKLTNVLFSNNSRGDVLHSRLVSSQEGDNIVIRSSRFLDNKVQHIAATTAIVTLVDTDIGFSVLPPELESSQYVDFDVFYLFNSSLLLDASSVKNFHLYGGNSVVYLIQSTFKLLHESTVADNVLYLPGGESFDHYAVECKDSVVEIDRSSHIRENHVFGSDGEFYRMGNVDCDHAYDVYKCSFVGEGKRNAECPMHSWIVVLITVVTLICCAFFYLIVICLCRYARGLHWRIKQEKEERLLIGTMSEPLLVSSEEISDSEESQEGSDSEESE